MANSERPLTIIIKNNDGTSNDITMYSVDGKLPTTIEIGGTAKATEISISETEIKDDDLSTLTDSPKDDLESQAPPKKTSWLQIYTTIQQVLSALCSIVISVTMIMTLVKFFSTSHITGAWPTNPKLYPTYILLIVSLMGFCIDILNLGARYCGTTSARKADLIASKIRYIVLAIQTIASATGTGVFNGTKAGGSAQDLFGWSCSPAADQLADINSSDLVCNTNTSSSYISIAHTCLHVLSILITIIHAIGPQNLPTQVDSKPGKGDEVPLSKTASQISTNSRKPSAAGRDLTQQNEGQDL